jgi:hypothetical protein
MRTPEDAEAFDEALKALYETRDPATLPSFFAAFDDATEYQDVMWGLVHTTKAFALRDYLRELGLAVPKMLPRAKEWAKLLHLRLLSSEKETQAYSKLIPTFPERTQQAIRKLLTELAAEEPEEVEGIKKLRGDSPPGKSARRTVTTRRTAAKKTGGGRKAVKKKGSKR